MSDEVVLIIAVVAAVILLFALIKLLGSVVKALLIAIVAAVALYVLLPRLEQQEGAIGDAARKALEVTGDLEGSVESLKDQAAKAGQRVSDGLETIKEAAETADEVQRAVDKTRLPIEESPVK